MVGYTTVNIAPDNHVVHVRTQLHQQPQRRRQLCRSQYNYCLPKHRRRRSQRHTHSKELSRAIDPSQTSCIPLRQRTPSHTIPEEPSPLIDRSQSNCSLSMQRRTSHRGTVLEKISSVIDQCEVGVSRWETSCPTLSYDTNRGDKTPSIPFKAPTAADKTSGRRAPCELPPKFPARSNAATSRPTSSLDVMLF